MKREFLGVIVSAALLLPGCASQKVPPPDSGMTLVTDKTAQAATTPDAALARLLAGNERFVSGHPILRDLPAQARATADGQYPYAVVLSCIDSRTAPELVFDQGIGDIFAPRIAGNYADVGIMGSIEFATQVAGAKLILVVGHSSCGAIKGTIDDVQLGNLTSVVAAIKPAVSDVSGVEGERNSHNKTLVQKVAEANVRRTLQTLRASSPVIAELEKSGKVKIVGAMQDLKAGRVVVLN